MSPMPAGDMVEHLDSAMNAVLAARVALGGPDIALPAEALDEALRAHPKYRTARREIRQAMERLQPLLAAKGWQTVLALEAATNEAMVRSSEVAWSLGATSRRCP